MGKKKFGVGEQKKKKKRDDDTPDNDLDLNALTTKKKLSKCRERALQQFTLVKFFLFLPLFFLEQRTTEEEGNTKRATSQPTLLLFFATTTRKEDTEATMRVAAATTTGRFLCALRSPSQNRAVGTTLSGRRGWHSVVEELSARRRRVRASSSSSTTTHEAGDEEETTRRTYIKSGPKQRLDELTLQTNPELSRNVVQSWIQQGKVLVDGQKITKPGTKLKPSVKIEVLAEEPKFVCRGGLKLEKALQFFDVDVRDKICLDSGLSTGGFTDCLLQQGAKKVYGVDVGYGQVHEKIRTDERVVVMERQNLRYLESLPDLVEVVTLDLSFISVLKVLPSVAKVSKPNGDLIVLIKPQFEARREQIGSKGVVRDTKVHEEVIQNVIEGAKTLGYEYINHTVSPIKGAKEGNTEFLGHFRYV